MPWVCVEAGSGRIHKDVLSYAIPIGYENEYMDSRLCPEIVNVSVNVVDAINLFRHRRVRESHGRPRGLRK